jgi:hypothetical protein
VMVEIGLTLRLMFISIPSWVLMAVIRVVLICIGWVVVPVAVLMGAYKRYEKASIYGEVREEVHFTWRVMWYCTRRTVCVGMILGCRSGLFVGMGCTRVGTGR